MKKSFSGAALLTAATLALAVASARAQTPSSQNPSAQQGDFVTKAANLLPSKQWREIKSILVEGIKGMPENWAPVEVQPGAAPETERVLFHSWDPQELFAFILLHIPQQTAGAPGPSYSRANYLLSAVEFEPGNLKAAEEALDHGLKLEPDQPTLLSEKAFLYQKQKRYQDALGLYKKAASMRPWAAKSELARAWRGQGDCLIELGQRDAAEAALRNSLLFTPGNLQAVNSIGFVRNRRLNAAAPKPLDQLPPVPVDWNQILSARLVTKVDPIYPSLVEKMRIHGVVKYNAVNLADGTIGELTVVSGPASLRESATEALRQWVFNPVPYGDVPVTVKTQIDIEVKPAEPPGA